MARQVVKRLVNSIRTPPVTPPPVMPSTMVLVHILCLKHEHLYFLQEEDIFATINPGVRL